MYDRRTAPHSYVMTTDLLHWFDVKQTATHTASMPICQPTVVCFVSFRNRFQSKYEQSDTCYLLLLLFCFYWMKMNNMIYNGRLIKFNWMHNISVEAVIILIVVLLERFLFKGIVYFFAGLFWLHKSINRWTDGWLMIWCFESAEWCRCEWQYSILFQPWMEFAFFYT